jgi:hypothetical protein
VQPVLCANDRTCPRHKEWFLENGFLQHPMWRSRSMPSTASIAARELNDAEMR